MKNIFLKFFLFCILIMMSCLDLPIIADAETEGNYTYTVTNGEATITDFSTSVSGSITIPLTLGGYPVTNIR